MGRIKHTCVDLTEVSPLVGLGVGVFTKGHAALKAASSKCPNMEKRVLTINMFLYHLYLTFLAS